jgi:aspartate 1-decarboxylase
MLIRMLQAKLHRASVTNAVLGYEGSCGLDEDLIDLVGMREYQYIEIYNVNNGERFSTYVLKAPRGSREVSLNGAAARKAAVGDPLIICAYSDYEPMEAAVHVPRIALLDGQNNAKLL